MCRIEMGSWMLGVDRCLIKVEKGLVSVIIPVKDLT